MMQRSVGPHVTVPIASSTLTDNGTIVIAFASVAVGSAILIALLWMARAGRLPPWLISVLGATSLMLLAAAITADFTSIGPLMAQHSVTSSVVVTILIASTVYFTWEAREQSKQSDLANKVSAIGFAGIVEHLATIELALSFVGDRSRSDSLNDDQLSGRPLRWARVFLRDISAPIEDPRLQRTAFEDGEPPTPRDVTIIEQCVRRISSSLKEWNTLLSVSTAGTEAMTLMSDLRLRLMLLQSKSMTASLTGGCTEQGIRGDLSQLCLDTRVLSVCFDTWGSEEMAESVARGIALRTPTGLAHGLQSHSLPLKGLTLDLRKRLDAAWETVRTGTDFDTIWLDEARAWAREAHLGQLDKLERDYFVAHVAPIAEALMPFGKRAQMVGYLHNVLQDTSVTAFDLSTRAPAAVCVAVEAVTRMDGEAYESFISRAAQDPLSALAKLADNSVNLQANALLAERDPEIADRLRVRYLAARVVLLASVHRALQSGSLTKIGQPWILEDQVRPDPLVREHPQT
jgi:hypothetical protein